MVLSRTVSEILQVFLFLSDCNRNTPNFGGVPVATDRPAGVSRSTGLKLLGREMIFRRTPTYVIMVPKRRRRTDRPTDRRTTSRSITALCVASHGKDAVVPWRHTRSVITQYY